jgi:methionyl-tRNA formyltransferase
LDLAGRLAINSKGEAIYNFGKHKDKTIKEVMSIEPGYYGWMISKQTDFPLYTKECLKREMEKIKKEEARIEWHQEVNQIDRKIRAFNPSPGAFTTLNQEIIKIWMSENISDRWQKHQTSQPGEILEVDEFGICVAGNKGVIRLLEVQKAGSKRMSASQFVKNMQLKPGHVFQ